MSPRQQRTNPLRKLIQDELDRKQWIPADLVRASGLSAQLISNLLNDERDQIDQMPKRETLSRIAYGLRIPEATVLRSAAAAWGIPLEGSDTRMSADDLSNDELLATLARRLGTQSATRRLVRAAHDPSPSDRRR